ncbi:hypothetical protein AVEN_182785-1 [Araneus ventricosus]|uniref:Uncharacterized protein n=1 Tax=Araneus ventricosus TaxID=182803 RepID=A0A4Y2LQ63_ARAVE|nr:hypothetical protein AVEN_182785-1 [Araneus ventricosus]
MSDFDEASVPFAPLTYLELFSRAKRRNKTNWLIPPVHQWYQGSRPGGCLSIDCNRLSDFDDASVPSAPFTFMELFSRAKSRNKTIWLIPPVNHWYQGSRPGGCLSIDCNRRDQTTLTRFLSGHIRSLTFSDNSKCFEICPKCTAEQVTPDHTLARLGLSKQVLVSIPLLTLDFFNNNRSHSIEDYDVTCALANEISSNLPEKCRGRKLDKGKISFN